LYLISLKKAVALNRYIFAVKPVKPKAEERGSTVWWEWHRCLTSRFTLRSHWRFLVSSLFGYFEAERLGEAFLEQAFTLHADFVARMREPLQKPW